MQIDSIKEKLGPLQITWEFTCVFREVKPQIPVRPSFFSCEVATLFLCCSMKELMMFLKLFLVTPKACETLIRASWARTTHTSLGRDSEINFVCERGKEITPGKPKINNFSSRGGVRAAG